ncbi:MAG: outer membrane protein assembly factor BamA [Nitrospirae bacterium]|nr:outer membrane protein assembly factor BamA [Nitrospirota bacterium]
MKQTAPGWIVVAALAVLLTAHEAAPQTAPTAAGLSPDGREFDGQSITALIVDTRTRYTAGDLLKLTGVGVGRRFDAGAIRASIDRLYATGQFALITIEAEETPAGISLIYHLWAKQRLRELTITGRVLSFPLRELRNTLQLDVGDEFDRERLQTALVRLQQFYTRQGYMQTRATPTVATQPNQADIRLVITIDEGPPALIGALTLAGRLGLPEADVRRRIDLHPGGRYTALEIDERIEQLKLLYAEHEFLVAVVESPIVRYDPSANAVALTITVHAGPQVTIAFPGKPFWYSESRLRERLLIQAEQSIEQDVLDASAERMQNLLREDGYLTAAVHAERSESPDRQQASITFHLDAGPRFTVGRLTVTGAQEDHASSWRKPLVMRPALLGLSHPRFDPVARESDLSRVRQWYSEHGYLSAVIEGGQTLQTAKGTVDLTITVQEGTQTRIGRIDFSGDTHLPDDLLQAFILSRAGQPYNPAQARADRMALLALYAGKGYLATTVTLEPRFNESRTEATLPFIITEGPPTFVGSIIITGPLNTDAAVLQRELAIHPGDPYDYAAILRSRHNLSQLGIFRDIKLEPIEAQQTERLKDLKLSVVERPAGTVEFGAGYGREEKFRGFAQISHKNLAGTGRRASVRVEADFLEQRYLLNYVEPWAAGLPLDLRLTTLYEHRKEVTFDRQSYGGTAGFDKNITERLKFSLLYRYTRNRYKIDPGAKLSTTERKRVNIGSLTPGLILDLRDDPFNPTRGSIHSLTFEDAAQSLGSQVQLVKATASTSWFFSPHRLIVLAFSARAGIAKEFGETTLVPLGERFYLGGLSTVRGYRLDTLGALRVVPAGGGTFMVSPDSTLSASGDPIGGNVMLMSNLEARIALPKHLGLVLFLDGGDVWTRPKTVDLQEVKFSVGAGIRYNTPVGPLRLDWGYKLRPINVYYPGALEPIRIDQSRYEIHFTLGNAF